MGCSVDSEFVHLAWTNTPRNQGGIGKLKFPLLADVRHTICQVTLAQSLPSSRLTLPCFFSLRLASGLRR